MESGGGPVVRGGRKDKGGVAAGHRVAIQLWANFVEQLFLAQLERRLLRPVAALVCLSYKRVQILF